jgi:dolichyl-phosphate-mannose-protein mannosyltransferase
MSEPETHATKGKFLDLSLHYKYDILFLILLLASIGLRVLWLDVPDGTGPTGTLIFDEYYYVNVARSLLRWPRGPNPPFANFPIGVDPTAQPPLAKLMIAASMLLLGDNAWGWRLPSVIMGSLSILLLYLLMKRISRNGRYSLLTTFVFSFDTMIFIDSRIAILDIFSLAFMLLGFYLYFLNRTKPSAIALALSTLTKVIGIYGFLVIAVYHLVKDIPHREFFRKWRSVLASRIVWLIQFGFYYAAAGFALLFVLDQFVGFRNPFDHISFIYNNLVVLVQPVPLGIASDPLRWLLNQVQFTYYGLSIGSGGTNYQTINFVGAMNPFIIYLTIPAMAYALFRYDQRDSQVALFLLCWFACTYFPYFPVSYISHRISYLFYFQNTIPAVAGAIALLFSNKHIPRTVIVVYALVVLMGFAWYFPFKVIPP